MPDPNLPLLEEAARKLTPFLDEIVFVGGITLGLLITDEAAAPVRVTNDVDVIAEIVTYADYIDFSERLRAASFSEDSGEQALTCRWYSGSLILDVMAIDAAALGFTNRWYAPAINHANALTLPSGRTIRVITAQFFLGTKMEAFRTRGRMDFQASHDLEDFVAVVEGRDSLVDEVRQAPVELRQYLADAATVLLAEPRFLDVLPGYVLDPERVPLLEKRLALLAGSA